MSMIIHALEACVGLLAILLAAQITRQYRLAQPKYVNVHEDTLESSRNAFRANTSARPAISPQSIAADKLASKLSASEIPVLFPESASSQSSVSVQEQSTTASAILDDYIGGFFAEPAKPEVEIKAFRSVDESEAETLFKEAKNDHVSDIAAAVDISAFKASAPQVKDNIPVLNIPIPESLITERFVKQVQELDSEVITVEEESPVAAQSKVMSDKVVLAMLGEAKLVSSN